MRYWYDSSHYIMVMIILPQKIYFILFYLNKKYWNQSWRLFCHVLQMQAVAMMAKRSSIIYTGMFFTFTKCLENEWCKVRMRVEKLQSFADHVQAEVGL